MAALLIRFLPYALAGVTCFAGGFGTAWRWQAANITELELDYAEQQLTDSMDARDETERQIASLKAADVKAMAAIQRTAADRVLVDAAGSGLRLVVAETVEAAREDAAACAANAAALGEVFDNCVEAYSRVAEHADLWTAEAVRQNEAAQ